MATNTRDDFHGEKISPRMTRTPEGFLVCHDVPIARTGILLYGASEVPVEPSADGITQIERSAEEVFRPETLASFEGKPVTIDHPSEEVTPDNWRRLAVGTVQNVRQGEGILNDLQIADLVITDAEAIKVVLEEGLREVSCGYQADYEQQAPGRGSQRNIVGNHVALVSAGRCGTRCAIGDSEMVKGKRSFADRIRAAFMSKDAEAMEAAAKEAEMKDSEEEEAKEKKEIGTGDAAIASLAKTVDELAKAVKAMDQRMRDMADPDMIQDETDPADLEKKKETDDTILEAEKAGPADIGRVYAGDSAHYQSLAAKAEILAPGFKMPTHDSMKGQKAADCACQRKALVASYATDAGAAAIKTLIGDQHPKDLTLDAVGVVFNAAAALIAKENNTRHVNDGFTAPDRSTSNTVDSINEANRKFYARA